MNLGLTQVYLPGSVFKVVPFSAALEKKLITPQTTFPVPYEVKIGTHTFHDAERHPFVTLSASNILSQSSNIGTLQISRKVGKTGILEQVSRLGFGQLTDLGYPGESAGVMKTSSTWYDSDIASLPIGQVNAVTPLQVLDCYNAIANDGIFVQPRLVRGYIHPDGKIVAAPPSRHHRAVSKDVAATLRNMLQGVVTRGTGTNAAIPGYKVAGKTGTSQIPYPGSANFIKGAYNASFVGFAPADHPVLSMIVVIQRPRTSIFGGAVAAPVFKRVMMYALQHYNIPSTGAQQPKPGTTSLHSDVT
jgi:cell division protein FtsI (penicillin-binding protein 3)